AKKTKKKIEGVLEAIEKIKKEIEAIEKENPKVEKKKIRIIEEKEWYERFRYFFTTNNFLAICGKNAQQNQVLFLKYFNENDLFFHADIFGGGVLILKDGKKATKDDKLEASQFAACYSNAWEEGFSSIDVYALPFSQVKPSTKKGEFLLFGEREWFRNVKLCLRIGIYENKLIVIPGECKRNLEKEIEITPGSIKRNEAIEKISSFFGVEREKVDVLLPNGKFELITKK
ncbi:MAG: NFACT RNA binding domain-containing protein, partial [Candidatus Micrarchaeales archaeon]